MRRDALDDAPQHLRFGSEQFRHTSQDDIDTAIRVDFVEQQLLRVLLGDLEFLDLNVATAFVLLAQSQHKVYLCEQLSVYGQFVIIGAGVGERAL